MEVEDDEDLAAAIEWDQKSKRSANNELGSQKSLDGSCLSIGSDMGLS